MSDISNGNQLGEGEDLHFYKVTRYHNHFSWCPFENSMEAYVGKSIYVALMAAGKYE